MDSPDTVQRVLLVDDEHLIAESLAKIFRHHGFNAEAASCGEEALKKIETFRPDVLITDILMPGMDGLELACAVAKTLPACKIILFSGHADHIDLTPIKRAGVSFLLVTKPLAPTMLMKLCVSNPLDSSAKQPVILFVDGNEMQRSSIARMLQHAGFKVVEAKTGSEGIEKAVERPDLILLDLNLPDMSGFEVCRLLRDRASTAETPIVHLTAIQKDEASRVESMRAGANEYLTYPLDPDHLAARLRAIVQAYRSRIPVRKPA